MDTDSCPVRLHCNDPKVATVHCTLSTAVVVRRTSLVLIQSMNNSWCLHNMHFNIALILVMWFLSLLSDERTISMNPLTEYWVHVLHQTHESTTPHRPLISVWAVSIWAKRHQSRFAKWLLTIFTYLPSLRYLLTSCMASLNRTGISRIRLIAFTRMSGSKQAAPASRAVDGE